MTREDVLRALAQINEAIAALNVRLHPPPPSADDRAELEAELSAAEQSRDTLEQVLNNLPETAPAPIFATTGGGTADVQVALMQTQKKAAIAFSEAARKHASVLQTMLTEPVSDPAVTSGLRRPTKKTAAAGAVETPAVTSNQQPRKKTAG